MQNAVCLPASRARALDDVSVADVPHPWFLIQTMSRAEFCAAEDLRSMGANAIVPAEKVIAHPQGKKTIIERPCFSGYLYAATGNVGILFDARQRGHFFKFIEIKNQADTRNTLIKLERLMSDPSRQPISVHQRLSKGSRVYIHRGPFRGLDGNVEEDEGSLRLHVNVVLLGRSVSVEIDRSMIESLN